MRASEYLRHGSLLRLKTTMHASRGVANDWPGPGATGRMLPGIWRAAPGRSIESSGAGIEPEVCCRQRSTLMLTPGWPLLQSRDASPLRSVPAYVGCAGHTLSETSSGVFGAAVLSLT